MNRLPHIQGRDIFEFGGWQIILFEDDIEGGPDWRREFATLLPRLNKPDAVLKHDHRSQVGLVHLNGVKYVVKSFILQESWWWFQLTSARFPTLGEVACQNARLLAANGLLTPQPVLLMQRTKNGLVNDCRLVYRYLEGRTATNADAADIIDFIRRMHAANLIHRDPHPNNFIKTDKGLAALDPLRIRSSRSRYLKAYDVMLLEHDIPSAPDIYNRGRLGFQFHLAKLGHNSVRVYRRSKLRLRKIFGLNRHSGLK